MVNETARNSRCLRQLIHGEGENVVLYNMACYMIILSCPDFRNDIKYPKLV